jgi:hypothetical protein
LHRLSRPPPHLLCIDFACLITDDPPALLHGSCITRYVLTVKGVALRPSHIPAPTSMHGIGR